MIFKRKKKDALVFYLMDGEVSCWKCRTGFKAVGLLRVEERSGNEYVAKLKYVTEVDPELLRYITHRFPGYQRRFVKKQDKNYYVNTCPHCGVLTGDFHLFEKQGTGVVFNPYSPQDARLIRIRKVEMEGLTREHVIAEEGDSYSSRVILEGAKRVLDQDVSEEDVARLNGGGKDLCRCKGCNSMSMVVREGFLFYEHPVRVCGDCERTETVEGRLICTGSFAIYDDTEPYFPTPEEEMELPTVNHAMEAMEQATP